MSVKKRTPKELEAQAVKRTRRYANSVGQGYCDLTRHGRMCPDKAVRNVGDVWICQYHSDLVDRIKRDGQRKRVAA